MPVPFTSIEIISYTSGASAFVDDTISGQTPAVIRTMPPGHHMIVIRMNGYEEYNTSFDLNPGQSALISAALTPVRTPSPVPTKAPLPATGLIIILFFLAGLIVRLTGWSKPGPG